jgi:integrase
MPAARTKSSRAKPSKPRKDFPLFPHATGRWAKKVKGRFVYFGKVADDPAGKKALDLWLDQRDDLLAGRKPRATADGATVRELANAFLNAKNALVDTHEMTPRRWSDLYSVCQKLTAVFGKGRQVDDLQADDFEKLRASFAKTHGLATLHADLTRVRSIFNWGVAQRLIADRSYSKLIVRPSVTALRRDRFSKPKRVFSQPELSALIDGAEQPMRAMIMLAINCGYGNGDVALLTTDHLDLKGGWSDMPRPKTGAPRRMKLWTETVAAVKAALALRPKTEDKTLADRVFITAKGLGWEARAKRPGKTADAPRIGYEDNPVSKQFAKLLTACKIRRGGNGFYTLRRMFETIGGGCLDQVAVDYAMGHIPRASDMSAVYRQHIDDSRLEAVATHIHRWLFPPASKKRKPR